MQHISRGHIELWVKRAGYGLPVALVVYLSILYFAPFGSREFSFELGKESPVFTELEPGQNVALPEEDLERGVTYQRVIGSPAEFTLNTGRPFQKAKMNVEFENTRENIVEMELQRIPNSALYISKPLQNRWVDELDWDRKSDGQAGVTLLQRPSDPLTNKTVHQYASISDFLANPPRDAAVAAYRYNLKPYERVTPPPRREERIRIDKPLRGKHTMQTYLSPDEPLVFAVQFQDMNRSFGPDRFHFNVYNANDEKVFEQTIQDDGDESAGGVASARQSIDFRVADLLEGVHTVELDVSSDFLIQSIETEQDVLVFQNGLFLAGSEEYASTIPDLNRDPSTIFIVGKSASFSTSHPFGLQEITLDGRTLSLTEPGVKITEKLSLNAVPTPEDTIEIGVPKNDVQLSTDGVIAFSKEQIFLPYPGLITLTSTTNINTVDYIIASDYSSPEKNGFWKSAKAEFDLTQVQTVDNTLHFRFVAQGIGSHPSDFKIHKITVVLEKEPLTLENFLPRLKRFFRLS
ncbi:MAG: hypothetical protein HYV34_02825 [Candidatus Kerfeldbacteria bacterium]|nr:hypothetical protein [Candidatus Kerfeldbacteria bacterium]